jgi:hypothetical protein
VIVAAFIELENSAVTTAARGTEVAFGAGVRPVTAGSPVENVHVTELASGVPSVA